MMQKAVDKQLEITVSRIQAKAGKPNWKNFVLRELIELFQDLEDKLFVQDENGNVVKNKRGNPKVSPQLPTDILRPEDRLASMLIKIPDYS
jgi:hypothetical protein